MLISNVSWIGAQFTVAARLERFPLNDVENMEEVSKSPFEDVTSDFTFGGFWYVNFANLEEKNRDILEQLKKETLKKRSKSF